MALLRKAGPRAAIRWHCSIKDGRTCAGLSCFHPAGVGREKHLPGGEKNAKEEKGLM